MKHIICLTMRYVECIHDLSYVDKARDVMPPVLNHQSPLGASSGTGRLLLYVDDTISVYTGRISQ
jgi:hypothetical protein